MYELTKSAMSYSWAMSLFAVQQMTNLLLPADCTQPTRRVNAGSYSLTQASQQQLNDLLFGAFQIGDDVQRGVVDLMFDTATCRAFTPAYLSRLTANIVAQSQETLRVFTSLENARLAWQELRNNYEVFNLVKHVSSLLNIPAKGKDFDLEKLIAQAYALGAYPDLWAVEGLGHDYTMTFFPLWREGKPVRGIMTDGQAGVLPSKSLTMMHAGLGLAFAQQLLPRITPYSATSDVQKVLCEFATLVKDNSRPGYEGAAYESLGLVTRFWHSQMVKNVDKNLCEVEPEIVSYFWHGAGRAHYFLPIFFVPGLLSPWLAIEREAPHKVALDNLTAGLAWATTIVNIRQPRILENFLKYQYNQISKPEAFSNGVMSTLIMGIDITPDDVYINNFLKYRSDALDQRTAQLWDKAVGRPANEAVQRIYPLLKKHGCLGEIFHYQDLGQLVDQLEVGTRGSAAA